MCTIEKYDTLYSYKKNPKTTQLGEKWTFMDFWPKTFADFSSERGWIQNFKYKLVVKEGQD